MRTAALPLVRHPASTNRTTSAPAAPAKTALQTLAALGSSPDSGLAKADAAARLAKQGPNELPEKPNRPALRLAKRFCGLSAWMIELIAVLSFFLHKRADMWIALSLLVANAVLGFFQEQRVSAAVTALRSKLQVTARVLRDRSWQGVPARELVTGDVVRVRSGDFVPADVQLFDGALHIDQSALTGESNEVKGARPKLHVEEVTSRIVMWLLVIVGSLSAVTFVTAFVEGMRIVEVLPIVLVLLMSAVPVALPVMFTVSMAVGSMELGRRGVLVTRLSAIEDAANMDVLCADKTGTLTMNQLSLTGAAPEAGFTEDDVVRAGALASKAANADPIDVAFLHAARDRKLEDPSAKTISFEPFSAKTRHTEAVVQIGGKKSRVLKGALRTVAEAAGMGAAAIAALEKRADEQAQKGVRALAVARADGDGPLRVLGLALLYDAPRPESRRGCSAWVPSPSLPGGTPRRRTPAGWRPILPAAAWPRCSPRTSSSSSRACRRPVTWWA